MDNTAYKFYTDVWGGSLSKEDFDRYKARAWYILDCLTYGRITLLWPDAQEKDKTAISMAFCAVLDFVASNVQTGGRTVTTEIVGKHHVTFAAPTKSEAAQLRTLVQPYLCGVMYNGQSILYRGIEGVCCPC